MAWDADRLAIGLTVGLLLGAACAQAGGDVDDVVDLACVAYAHTLVAQLAAVLVAVEHTPPHAGGCTT
jgi:hypothetical protein